MKRYSLYSVLLLSALVVILLFAISSNCYAVSYDDVKEYVEATANYFPNNSTYQQLKSNVNLTSVQNGLNAMNIANYNNFIVYSQQKPRGYDIYYYFFNATNWNATSQSLTFEGQYIQGVYETQWSSWSGSNTINNNSINNVLASGTYQSRTENDYNNLRAMMYTLETFETTPITFVGIQAIPQYTYLIFENELENTAYNGNLLTYYYQGDFYSNSQILLGNITPNDSYYFEVRIRDSVTGIIKGTSFVSLNTTPVNIYNDGAIFINENYDVYIINRLLKYSTQYQLEIESYYGSGGTDLYEDIDWFIFLPQNAVVDNGVITSLGSGDFTNQDVTNQIIDNNNENFMNTIDFYQDDSQVNSEIDAMFSGDTNEIVSGLNFPNLENNYFVVIYNAVTGITDTLQMSGDPYFDISLHGETPKRIYASDFTTPPSVLKTFISMSMVFGTIYCLYLQLSGFINLLNTGHVKDAINQIDDISGATIYKM